MNKCTYLNAYKANVYMNTSISLSSQIVTTIKFQVVELSNSSVQQNISLSNCLFVQKTIQFNFLLGRFVEQAVFNNEVIGLVDYLTNPDSTSSKGTTVLICQSAKWRYLADSRSSFSYSTLANILL